MYLEECVELIQPLQCITQEVAGQLQFSTVESLFAFFGTALLLRLRDAVEVTLQSRPLNQYAL